MARKLPGTLFEPPRRQERQEGETGRGSGSGWVRLWCCLLPSNPVPLLSRFSLSLLAVLASGMFKEVHPASDRAALDTWSAFPAIIPLLRDRTVGVWRP